MSQIETMTMNLLTLNYFNRACPLQANPRLIVWILKYRKSNVTLLLSFSRFTSITHVISWLTQVQRHPSCLKLYRSFRSLSRQVQFTSTRRSSFYVKLWKFRPSYYSVSNWKVRLWHFCWNSILQKKTISMFIWKLRLFQLVILLFHTATEAEMPQITNVKSVVSTLLFSVMTLRKLLCRVNILSSNHLHFKNLIVKFPSNHIRQHTIEVIGYIHPSHASSTVLWESQIWPMNPSRSQSHSTLPTFILSSCLKKHQSNRTTASKHLQHNHNLPLFKPFPSILMHYSQLNNDNSSATSTLAINQFTNQILVLTTTEVVLSVPTSIWALSNLLPKKVISHFTIKRTSKFYKRKPTNLNV